ncbi:acetyltransferase At1g77540-like [Panicum virgatum]|uniref:acetyltransferase At1g77540-like n=1 Tax=Panicum virgatum TaxID=38727 RepID=UPI0019D66CBF|nr:acetyltransferase At1g77540-like [Panicum virgatum]
MSTKEGGTGGREVEAPPPETESIVWSEDAGRFQTPDGEPFLEYRVPSPAVMDMVHTYVPRSKRGQGLAARFCDAAFAHARARGMRVLPTCSYITVRDPLFSSAPLLLPAYPLVLVYFPRLILQFSSLQ